MYERNNIHVPLYIGMKFENCGVGVEFYVKELYRRVSSKHFADAF